jgi:hypothetical protein
MHTLKHDITRKQLILYYGITCISFFWTFGEYKHTCRPSIKSQESIQHNISVIYAYSSSKPLGNTSIRILPNITSQQVNQYHNSASHAYMSFRTFGEYRYTCTPNIWHLIKHIQFSRLSLYICFVPFKLICILIRLAWNTLLKHVTHHHAMHALILFLGF